MFSSSISLWLRFRWLHLPAALLSILLQRAPMLRSVASAEASLGSPISALWRSAFAAAALGGYHALAGATQLTSSPSSPASATVGQSFTLVFAVIGAPATAASYEVRGTLPPGLSIPGLSGDLLNASTGTLTGTPTTAGSYTMLVRAWNSPNKGANGGLGGNPTFSLIVNVAAAPVTAPVFTQHPASISTPLGGTATFSATATGGGTITYQWSKDGGAIPGATGQTLALAGVTTASAGVYRVTATNSGGSTQSNPATLTVVVPPAPVIAQAPVAQSISVGAAVAFTVNATGSDLTYQWNKDGAAVAGANSPLFLLRSATAAQAGNYTVTVTNGGGSVTSAPATLNVVAGGTQGRLINLSVLSFAGRGGQSLIAGFSVSGSQSNLLIRGIGPTLGGFGVPGVVADPTLEVLNLAGAFIGSNDNWSGADGSAVGGFALPANSKDAVLSQTFIAGGYTAQLRGVNDTTGNALVEVYEVPAPVATGALTNLSARTQVDAGATLITGFSIGAGTNRTVVIRAVGPTLEGFGVPDVLTDPRIVLFNNANPPARIGENDDWGGGSVLADTMASVGAFGLVSPSSKDAVIVATLPPGGYTAQVTSGTSSGGVVLVELYLLP